MLYFWAAAVMKADLKRLGAVAMWFGEWRSKAAFTRAVLLDGKKIPPPRSVSAFALLNFCKLEALGEPNELLQKGHDDRANRGHGRP